MEWTGARYADRPIVEAKTWIDASAARVWELVSDIELMPRLSAELQEVEWLDGARTPAVGARFLGRNRNEYRGEWETCSHIIECDAGSRFAWAVSDVDEPAAVWRFTLSPVDGGTELTQWVQMGPGPSGLTMAIERMPDKEQKIVFVRMREFENGMTATLAGIKKLAEAG